MKKFFKYLVKNNQFVQKTIHLLIYIYIKFVFLTSKYEIIIDDNVKISKGNSTIYAIWHNSVFFAGKIFENHKNIATLISPHSDGKLLAGIVKKAGFRVIEGSSNKNPSSAIKSIIKYLKFGNDIIITPDGPRGPVYEINSNITAIAEKFSEFLIPIGCSCKSKFFLKSWDKMIIPMPFNKLIVIIGAPLDLSGNKQQDNEALKQALIRLKTQADELALK